VILQRGWLVATLIRVIVSPCLSYLLHGLLATSFQLGAGLVAFDRPGSMQLCAAPSARVSIHPG
jgi:hypothetical protein